MSPAPTYDPGVRNEWDAIVVGLGAIGSGAAYWLSRRSGDRVLGIEQFELGHGNGAGQDHSRIIRLSYHRPDYVRLARRAYAAWAEVEADSGTTIVTRTGGLDIGPRDGAIPLGDYSEAMTAENVPFEHLDGPEIARRWPQWRLGDEHHGLFQADAGIADPNRANAAHQRLARRNGATLLEHSPVTRLRDAGDGTTEIVLADGTVHRASRVVIAADAWTNELLASFDRRLPLTIIQAQVTYFASPDVAAFSPDRFPIWIWMDDPSFYGFPTYGEAGPKSAEDVGGDEVTPATRTFERNEVGFARLTDFLGRHLPGQLGPEIYTKTCLYTLTPDRDFVVDRLPDHPGVLVALGAAHAFKFASVLGRILAELALDGRTPSAPEIERFRIDRPILLESNPATSFLV
ncbi:MAG TPA: N-methyl-L-tryptophan oxidase [Candidatus Limnocylindrales bacterium]|nr:N-methyl-L-tryptophan oxidase [Candidatus Limnocylindrales bacterium]